MPYQSAGSLHDVRFGRLVGGGRGEDFSEDAAVEAGGSQLHLPPIGADGDSGAPCGGEALMP